MKTKNTLILFAALLTTLVFSQASHATKCGQFIYNKKGWLRKYNWLPNTVSENTKKNGIASSTIKPSTEGTTASVDPGVSTGATVGATQSWSSWGDCSFINLMKGAEYKQKYLEENLDDVKKQIAMGHGGHIESIAAMNSCPLAATARLGTTLQKNYDGLSVYSEKEAQELSQRIDEIISNDTELKQICVSQI